LPDKSACVFGRGEDEEEEEEEVEEKKAGKVLQVIDII